MSDWEAAAYVRDVQERLRKALEESQKVLKTKILKIIADHGIGMGPNARMALENLHQEITAIELPVMPEKKAKKKPARKKATTSTRKAL